MPKPSAGEPATAGADPHQQPIAGLRGVHAPLEALFDAVYARRRDLR